MIWYFCRISDNIRKENMDENRLTLPYSENMVNTWNRKIHHLKLFRFRHKLKTLDVILTVIVL